jgi:phage gp29-like protein
MAVAKAVVATPANSEADAYAAFGTGQTDAQKVRKSNLWRDNYNPLRGMVMARLITIFEAAERGAYAELQLLLRKSEKRYPIFKGFIEKFTSSLDELDWDIKIKAKLPPGATPAMAEAQQLWLRNRYELVQNLKEACAQLALAEVRGYTVLQKHRYEDGKNAGAVRELYWLEPWVWARDGYYGDFYYNEISRFGVGLGSCASVLGELNRIGSENLPREEFVIREVESPLYEIALIAFLNWLMGRKDWAAFTEIFGLAKGVVIMPPNIAVGKEQDYQAAAEKVSDGVSGALPNGSDIKFPTAGVRGESPFEKFCDAQDKDVVIAGTGGQLTMLANDKGGLGSGPNKQHHDEWEKIATAKARQVNEILQRDFDAPELAAKFPDQPVCVYFSLGADDEEDVSSLCTNVAALATAGYKAETDWLSEKTGYELEDATVEERAKGSMLNAKGSEEMLPPIKNRATSAPDFAASIADDLKILRDRVAAIAGISDPELRKQKIQALLADWKTIESDITADPESARVLETINATELLAGLKGKHQ